MKLIKLLVVATASSMTLSGCIVSNLVGVGDTDFIVGMSQEKILGENDPTFIVKVTLQLANKCGKARGENKENFFGEEIATLVVIHPKELI